MSWECVQKSDGTAEETSDIQGVESFSYLDSREKMWIISYVETYEILKM